MPDFTHEDMSPSWGLHVCHYLKTHSLEDLAREHGVYARFSTKNLEKFTLNYDQLEARDADPISQECRGLVLEMENRLPESGDLAHPELVTVIGATKILARPMNRFFNYGQGAAASVNFDDPKTCFLEKMDGTLCILYWDRELMEWCVATRSVPDADLTMDGFGNQTFSDLFWKAFKASGGTLENLDYARGNMTFCFELCTPDNQVVVRYNDYKVYLLAVLDNHSASEDFPENWNSMIGVPVVPSYRLNSTEQMLNFVSSRDPSSFEGIVVRDARFNRVKVKNAGYLALNKLKDSVAKSPRAAMEIILLEKEDDVYPLLTEQARNFIVNTKEKLRVLLAALDAEYEACYSTDRKAFALAIQAGSGYLGPHMSRWTGRSKNAHNWIMSNRKNGTWSDSFLDMLISMCK